MPLAGEPRLPHFLVLVHGLEGSCNSAYVRGAAEKAFVSGFNVIRMNQRNCGGTDRLTPIQGLQLGPQREITAPSSRS